MDWQFIAELKLFEKLNLTMNNIKKYTLFL